MRGTLLGDVKLRGFFPSHVTSVLDAEFYVEVSLRRCRFDFQFAVFKGGVGQPIAEVE